MLHLFAAFDDEVKTIIIKRVLDDVKMSSVTFGLRTGLLASKELVGGRAYSARWRARLHGVRFIHLLIL